MRRRSELLSLVWLVLSSGASSAEVGDWREVIPPNAAYARAQDRPPFRMSDPVGLVEDDAEKARQRRSAESLRERIALAARRGDRRLVIPPGEYRFADNRGLALEDLADIEIVARGVKFWFERPLAALAADPKGLELIRCRRVVLRGLVIDFDPPVFLQAKIVSIDEAAPSLGVEIDPGFPDAEMEGGSYFLYRADGSWIRHGYLFHRGTRRVEGRRHDLLLGDGRVFAAHRNDAGNLELTGGACRFGLGDYVVLPWRRGKGIHIHRCEECVLEDIDEHASPGMGVLEHQGGGGNVYRRLRIRPPAGTRRLHACAADGFHNAQTERGPRLIECEFTGTSDDFVNLHGHFGVVWHRLDDRTLVVGQANLGELRPGEELSFYDDDTVELLGRARVTRIEPLRDRALAERCDALGLQKHASRVYHRLSLDRRLPVGLGDLVALDRFRSAGFEIRDCYFHDAMARTLINGAGDGTISGNVIERAAWGLVVHFETWQYYEGPMPRGIRVTGNVLREICDLLLPQHATAISVTMVPKDGGVLRTARPLRDIEISRNYIERPGGFGILVTNTCGALIAENVIVAPMYRPAMTGGDLRTIQFHIGHPSYFGGKARRAAIGLWSSSDVAVRANRLIDPAGHCVEGLVQIGDHCDDVRVSEGRAGPSGDERRR